MFHLLTDINFNFYMNLSKQVFEIILISTK